MQAGDSLWVSNACEMVQISTRLSRFFRWAWPSASENGATTTMDENKPLMGGVCNGKQVAGKFYSHAVICAHSLHCNVGIAVKIDFEAFLSGRSAYFKSTISARAPPDRVGSAQMA
jgi:hypothetical protein